MVSDRGGKIGHTLSTFAKDRKRGSFKGEAPGLVFYVWKAIQRGQNAKPGLHLVGFFMLGGRQTARALAHQ